ncbi:MAG: ribosome biogenesis GTPase Der [Acidobacteriota bacterium]
MGTAEYKKVAIVGRPNVGKSTLFNRLVGRRKAIVHDLPGITRDRVTGEALVGGAPVVIVDTGGFDTTSDDVIRRGIKEQVERAIRECDLILFIVDSRAPLTAQDLEIAEKLRKSGKPVLAIGHKVDTTDPDAQERQLAEVHRLGLGDVLPVSAEHNLGVETLREVLQARLGVEAPAEAAEPPAGAVKVAIVGRPNVGKSSILNALVRDERCLVTEVAGTTRDSIDVLYETRRGERYLFIDTAGIRKKGKVDTAPEKLSVVMAIKSLERCDVALVVVDAREGIGHQDAVVAGYAYESGKAVVVLANKWDLTLGDAEYQKSLLGEVRDKMKFLDFAPILKVSARSGAGLGRVFGTINKVHEGAAHRVGTGELNRFCVEVLRETAPIVSGRAEVKIYYMTQTGTHPPTFTLFTNPKGRKVHFSYVRFLENRLRERFGFEGTPIRFKFVAKKPRRDSLDPRPPRARSHMP